MGASTFPVTVFVLGTSRDCGKTVASIGIISKLLSTEYGYAPDEIGYMKPVGQDARRVTDAQGQPAVAERDAILVTGLLGLPMCAPADVSPVLWSSGRTEDCIDASCCGNPRQVRDAYLARIGAAYCRVARGKQLMVMEGTGQLGVGSVGGVSGGEVAGLLRAMGVPLRLVMVVRGEGVGGLEHMVPHILMLEHLGERLDGVIVNRVPREAGQEVTSRVARYIGNVFPILYPLRCQESGCPRVLGYVPDIPELSLPTMRLVAEHFASQAGAGLEVLTPFGRAPDDTALIRRVMVVSLEQGYEEHLADGDAVIVGINSNARIVSLLEYHVRARQRGRPGLAGLILSCRSVGGLLPILRPMLDRSGLPVLAIDWDSAEIAAQLHHLVVKIQPYDEAKRALIAQAYCAALTGLATLVPPARARARRASVSAE